MLLHLFQAVVLGAVQGVTEFLPISSTAHLIIGEKIFNLNQETYGLSFDVFTSIGTFIALIIFFRNEIAQLIKNIKNPIQYKVFSNQEKIPWLILLATIPAGLVGLILHNQIETSFRSIQIIATSLIAMGIIMIISDLIYNPLNKVDKLSKSIIWMGIAQALALVPGISRSGATITTGIFFGLNRERAAKYSFLLSIPITFLAIIKSTTDLILKLSSSGITPEIALFYLSGLISSTIFGFFTVKFLLFYLKKYSLSIFGYYRIVLGIMLLIFEKNL